MPPHRLKACMRWILINSDNRTFCSGPLGNSNYCSAVLPSGCTILMISKTDTVRLSRCAQPLPQDVKVWLQRYYDTCNNRQVTWVCIDSVWKRAVWRFLRLRGRYTRNLALGNVRHLRIIRWIQTASLWKK